MIEIPMREVHGLLDNKIFFAVVRELKNLNKLQVDLKYGGDFTALKAQFKFADKRDELSFKIKFGHLIAQ